MTYIVRQKRGNKKAVAVGSFVCESNFLSNVKEEFYKTLWLMGVPVSSYSKYCFSQE